MHPSPHPSPSRGLQVLGRFCLHPAVKNGIIWIRWVDKKKEWVGLFTDFSYGCALRRRAGPDPKSPHPP